MSRLFKILYGLSLLETSYIVLFAGLLSIFFLAETYDGCLVIV
jgi:hypothetical protein